MEMAPLIEHPLQNSKDFTSWFQKPVTIVSHNVETPSLNCQLCQHMLTLHVALTSRKDPKIYGVKAGVPCARTVDKLFIRCVHGRLRGK